MRINSYRIRSCNYRFDRGRLRRRRVRRANLAFAMRRSSRPDRNSLTPRGPGLVISIIMLYKNLCIEINRFNLYLKCTKKRN